VPLSGGRDVEERFHRPARRPAPRGGQERGPSPPVADLRPTDPGRAAAGGDRAGGDAGPHLALAGQPHRSKSALLPAGRGGDARWPGAGPDGTAGERGHLQPRQLPGRHPAPALRPRCGVGTLARSRRREGRGGGAVLAETRRGGGDPGAGGGAGIRTDTAAVEEVFVKPMV